MQAKIFFVNGMFVRESGDGTDTIVYIHGLGEHGECFNGLIASPRLTGFRHIVPDLPGYGKSLRCEPLSFDALADFLGSWIRSWKARPVVVVGHSMGGVIGLRLTERHPDLVAKLVNIEGNVSADDCAFSGKAIQYALDRFIQGGFEELRQRIAKAPAPASQKGYTERMACCDPKTFYVHSKELLDASSEEDLARRAAALRTPKLYMIGEPEHGGISTRSRELLEQAGITPVEIPGTGHWPFLDDPDTFVDRITTFLEFSY